MNLRPGLRGAYQRTNAVAVAASILDALRAAGIAGLPLEAVREGIEQAAWPGRFEVVDSGPPIVIDGAHNPAAAIALRQALDEAYPGRPRIYVLGVAADKDVAEVIRGCFRVMAHRGSSRLEQGTHAPRIRRSSLRLRANLERGRLRGRQSPRR